MVPRLLLVDGFNLFYANYYSSSKLNQNGEPIGGAIGFLKQLRNIIYSLSPQQVVIVFDGPNAGYRRKLLFKDYKGKRARKIRHSRVQLGETKEDDVQVNSEQEQLKQLYELLKLLPVKVVIIPYFEADDVIAHLAIRNQDKQVIIVSSDKDFLQLISTSTTVYQPFKHRLITNLNFQEIYGVKQKNFLFLRAIVGDTSDAFKGVKGVSDKTLFKFLPQIKEEEYESFDDFWVAVENIEGSSKNLTKLKEGFNDALLTYNLTQLGNTLNLKAIEMLNYQIEEQENKPYSKTTLKVYFMKNGLNFEITNYESWVSPFNFFMNKFKIHT